MKTNLDRHTFDLGAAHSARSERRMAEPGAVERIVQAT
jgi:hypothetical protein